MTGKQRIILALAIAGLLSACVTSGAKISQDAEAALIQRQNSAVTVEKLTFHPLKTGDVLPLELGAADPVLLVDNEYAFVKAFALPQWNGSYMIKVASFRVGSPIDPAILYPTVVFLDEAFKETRRSSPQQFVYRREGLNTGDGLHATFFFNEANRGDRYLILASRRQLPEGNTRLSGYTVNMTPITVPVGAGAVTWVVPTSAANHNTPMAASASGRVSLEVQAYQPIRIEPAGKSGQ